MIKLTTRRLFTICLRSETPCQTLRSLQPSRIQYGPRERLRLLGEDEIYDPLLDDIDIATLMEDENGIDEAQENPAHETEGEVATREKLGTPGEVHDGHRSRHERSAFTVTFGSTRWTPSSTFQRPQLRRPGGETLIFNGV